MTISINRRTNNSLTLVLLLILAMLTALSIFIGPQGFSFTHVDGILQYRGARILLAIIAGSSLAVSGATLQAIFRNPLADPHIFGISGGAALGASLVIAFCSELTIIPSVGAIFGGLATFLLLFYYLYRAQSSSLSQCLLVGILINAIASALITVLKTTLPMNKTQSLLFWLVGHISVVAPQSFLLIIPLWLIGMMILFSIRGELEILSFGVDESRLLGINAHRVIKMAVIANCLLIGNVVAFAGMIGFLGLVVPHLVRLLVSTNQFVVVPLSAIGGAILLVFFDTLSRMSFALLGTELPVGAMSALLLSPIFFMLLIKDRAHE